MMGYRPHVGDRVLVQRTDAPRERAYVIGVLHPSALSLGAPASAAGEQTSTTEETPSGALSSSGSAMQSGILTGGEPADARPTRLETPSGDRAELCGSALELRNDRGELLIRFHTDTRELELVSAGDLSLRAPGGTLRFAAETIELDATTTRASAERLELTAGEAELAAGSLRLSAERVMSRAEEAYVEVERLLETRAARARLLVKSTLELFARRTSIRSEEDTRVDGKRVLLG